MLRRTLTALVLAIIGLPAIIYGGVFYFLLMGIFLVGAPGNMSVCIGQWV
jgi:hypothetical protein